MKEELKKWSFADLKAAGDMIKYELGETLDNPGNEAVEKLYRAIRGEMLMRISLLSKKKD